MKQLTRIAVLVLAAACLAMGQNQPYFDPPTFVPSGVTDPASRGGHGSDPVLQSTESLARDTASLGGVDAKDGNPLQALRQYQRAVELNPSEANLFDLGAELLKHRAAEQASEVLMRANRLFPKSSRILLGLAVARYSLGSFEEARDRFFEATDLDPADVTPYLFLGKAQSPVITQSPGFASRMERFARLHPENASANYFFATTLPKGPRAQALIEKAVRLDPKLSGAWLQLGIVYADANHYGKAISAWQRAAAADPRLAEAHYRLSQAYRRAGDGTNAKREIELFEKVSKEAAEEQERQRAGIKQFVFELK